MYPAMFAETTMHTGNVCRTPSYPGRQKDTRDKQMSRIIWITIKHCSFSKKLAVFLCFVIEIISYNKILIMPKSILLLANFQVQTPTKKLKFV